MSKEKYLVATMDEREKTIAKLKASLYSISIDELVKNAINDYTSSIANMACSYCNEQTVVSKKKPREFYHSIAGKDHIISVANYPINTCCTCGAEFNDMNLSVYTNELVRYEIIECLKIQKSIPSELDFNEILKM